LTKSPNPGGEETDRKPDHSHLSSMAPKRGSIERYLHLHLAWWRGLQPAHSPAPGTAFYSAVSRYQQNDDSYLSARKILLMPNSLVGSEKEFNRFFCHLQQTPLLGVPNRLNLAKTT
jgi:hypothetical protein